MFLVRWLARGEEHLGRGGVRVLLEEVVLDLPHVLDAELVGELDLVERVLDELVLASLVPGPAELVLVEDAELHGQHVNTGVYILSMAGRASNTIQVRTHSTVRLPRAQRREQIVGAAAAAFLTGGYEKTSMEDVARAAGVTRLIVYRIFESKEALYLAVLNAVVDDIAQSSTDGADPERQDSESIVALLLATARRHPDGFRLLWRHTSNQGEFHEVYRLFEAAAHGLRGGPHRRRVARSGNGALGRRDTGELDLREHLPVARPG